MSDDPQDESRADADSSAKAPPADIVGDDGRPLGDTDEAHDEISPHDLPVGHPGRQAAEEQAEGKHGTTRGHDDPTDAPPDGARR